MPCQWGVAGSAHALASCLLSPGTSECESSYSHSRLTGRRVRHSHLICCYIHLLTIFILIIVTFNSLFPICSPKLSWCPFSKFPTYKDLTWILPFCPWVGLISLPGFCLYTMLCCFPVCLVVSCSRRSMFRKVCLWISWDVASSRRILNLLLSINYRFIYHLSQVFCGVRTIYSCHISNFKWLSLSRR